MGQNTSKERAKTNVDNGFGIGNIQNLKRRRFRCSDSDGQKSTSLENLHIVK